MKFLFCFLPAVYCLFVFSSCGNNATEKSQIKTAGQSLYETNCVSCHGEDGKLCVLGAKDISVSSMTQEQMMGIITNGKNTMTPFGNILNKEEIRAVADYVQTLKVK